MTEEQKNLNDFYGLLGLGAVIVVGFALYEWYKRTS